MKKKINVFITGVSGFIGQKLVERIGDREDIGTISGIDVVDPPGFRNRIDFVRHDVRDDMTALMRARAIDWAIHTAFLVPVLHDKKKMQDVDVRGTENFFEACGALRIPQVLHVSSTTAYGALDDNPDVLDEECALRGNRGFTYGESKASLENTVIPKFAKHHPAAIVTVVRPCFLCGPHFYKNPLGRHLMKRIIMIPADVRPLQFVHEDDVADAIYFLLKNRCRGAYNLAGDGALTFKEMARMTGGTRVALPPVLLFPLNDLAWFLRLSFITEFPSLPMVLLRKPWIAGNAKIKQAGFRFRYDSRAAFETFAEQVRGYRRRR